VHFAPPVERFLANRKVNITGDTKKCSDEYLVGDSGAGCSVIANPALLTHIRKSKQPMNIHCNSGITTTTLIGRLKGFRWVWHDPHGIANIISLSKLATKHRITMDTSIDNAIYIHRSDGTIRKFECTTSGIYCCNLRENDDNDDDARVFNVVTVEAKNNSIQDWTLIEQRKPASYRKRWDLYQSVICYT